MTRPSTGRRLGGVGRRTQPFRAAVAEPVRPTDANGVVLLAMRDTTDNGTTLSIPNRLGGSPATATGAGRATYSATAIDGRFPGIITTGQTQQLSIACDLSTRKSCTVYVVCESRVSSFASATAGVLFHQGTSTERIYARYDTYGAGALDGNVKAGKVSSIDTTEIGVRDLNGGSHTRPRVYCFTFDIDAGQEVGTPRGDDEALIIEAYVGTPSTGTLTNGTLFIGQNTALGQAFDGAIAAVYVRHGVHSAAEITTWTDYLQWFVGSTRRLRVAYVGDSRDYGSNANLGAYRAYFQTYYDAESSLDRWYSPVGRYPVDASKTFLRDYGEVAPGRTIALCKAEILADFGVHGGGIQQWHPDVIVYTVLINDLQSGGATLSAIEDAYVDLVQTGAAQEPTALHVCVAPFMRTDDAPSEARRVSFVATNFPSAIARLQGLGVTRIFADYTRSNLTGISMPDGLHPDQTANGYEKIALAEWPRWALWRAAYG